MFAEQVHYDKDVLAKAANLEILHGDIRLLRIIQDLYQYHRKRLT